jgi:hypothetical protein
LKTCAVKAEPDKPPKTELKTTTLAVLTLILYQPRFLYSMYHQVRVPNNSQFS